MQKRILFLTFLAFTFLFTLKVNAITIEEYKGEYQFLIEDYVQGIKRNKSFLYVTDDKKILYDINPHVTDFTDGKDFSKQPTKLARNQLEEISKIIYYGYGYQDHTKKEYYFATQYLIYQTFSNIDVAIMNGEEKSSDFDKFTKEIAKLVSENTFPLKDLETQELVLEITNPYILNNFNVSGENVKISALKSKINITLLNDLEEYKLLFKPKISCDDTESLKNAMGVEYLNMNGICEKEHSIVVKYNKPVVINEPEVAIELPKEEENEVELEETEEQEEEQEKVEEEDISIVEEEVNVPSTSKNNPHIAFLLFFIGNAFVIFKNKFFSV